MSQHTDTILNMIKIASLILERFEIGLDDYRVCVKYTDGIQIIIKLNRDAVTSSKMLDDLAESVARDVERIPDDFHISFGCCKIS